MKILIFYQYFTTPKGAWGTRIYEFSKEWVKKGHEVTVVTSIYSKSDIKAQRFLESQNFEGINVKIINLKIDNKQPKLRRMFSFIAYSLVSSWYAIFLKSDVVIASSGPITVGFPGLVSTLFSKKKLVYEVRDLWPEVPIEMGVIKNSLVKKIAYSLERTLYNKSSLVVALSLGMKNYIKNNFNHKNVVSITNSANLDLFSEEVVFPKNDKIKKSDFYVIYTGNIGETNNSYWLVNTARILKQKHRDDIKIVLVGDGQQKDEICSIIKKESLNNLIHFELMSKEKLIPYIQNAKASLVPLKDNVVLNTSSPNKFFESLAAGVPVIQTTNGWIKEYININQVGFNLDGNDANSLAELLVNLKSESILNLEVLKKNARECAVKDFNQKKLAKYYLDNLLLLN